jgi:hypothetical protein
MKNSTLVIMLVSCISSSAFAATATVEYQDKKGVDGTVNANTYQLSVKENITNNFAGDVSLRSNVKESSGTVSSSRVEVGLTGTTKVGIFNPYLRLATGQKFTTTKDFSYYSIEPGVTAPIGDTGFTARVGYRLRDAYDSTANADMTKTWRAGVAYNLTKKDTIGVRYDRERGDSNYNSWNFNYTRSF